ncbi:hypothetical protein SAMN04487911_1048 [Arenibacter nanhaiticus]|uniref:YD repeat-containing protein n=1 Tax=Arenibacter nanhaiticus TaxID=558155 RepID=A0A1M6CPM9_9FLAO|nr:hypothetical protein [Arenibacter nanhaiticus]SHI62843.1 hypothetical protein SAMN04487911_1048 [Arenibacter nanhaiticus]
MKKTMCLVSIFLVSILNTSCENESVSDEFKDKNGNVKEKSIKSISTTSAQDSQNNNQIILSYNTDGSLNSISDGMDTSIFVFKDDELKSITGGGDHLNVEELYKSPYDAFETGNVLNYDDNGNPEVIAFYEEEYDYNMEEFITKAYTAEISYDDTHNPFFYTLEAAGIINVLDGVKLNFSTSPQASEIIQARLLFPNNYPSQIVYKDEEGEAVFMINANSVYDEDNYPTSTTITTVSLDDSEREQNTYVLTFQYVD